MQHEEQARDLPGREFDVVIGGAGTAGVVAAVAYEVNRLAGRHWQSPVARAVAWPGMLMQRLLTTREPSDDEIEVALVALRVALAEETGQGPAEVGWRLDDWESFAAFEAEAKPIPGAAEVLGSERAA